MTGHIKFNQLLYEKLIGTDQHSIKMVARKTGTSLSTLYKYCEGTYNPPAEFVAKIYNATGDVDFLDFIINDTDKLLIDKQKGDADKTVVEEALDVAGACGKLIATVQEAMEDKKMTPSEKTCIEKSINRAQKELEDLRERIKE